MRVGIPKETAHAESRVAIVPEAVPKLERLGFEVLVERGAGDSSGFLDGAYEEKGAKISERKDVLAADIVVAVGVPEVGELKREGLLVCSAEPLDQPQRIAELAKAKVSCFALELVPRISRAQAMDTLSSMANIAGYKAVLLAAARLPKMFPLMMTAAGTVRPARVFVLGAGVAGLQAIATARRLGAVVEGYDIRPDTKEQVESLGARFIEFDLGAGDTQDAGGYAKELTDEQKARQAELMAEAIQASDVVITTAQVPGRKAPVLVPGKVVEGMKPGSVIVDMAATSGGNCELSEGGEEVVKHGVTIVGFGNLAGSVAQSASQLYSTNLVHFLGLLVKEGAVALDLEDEILDASLVCHEGQVRNSRVAEALS